MKKFEEIKNEIVQQLDSADYNYEGDLSDIGNEIGLVIGKHISKDLGYDADDFIRGLKHGISLIDGTH